MMAYVTIKPHLDRDLYVIFSTITDLPVCWGGVEDILKWLVQEQFTPFWKSEFGIFGRNYVQALERADKYGTSSRIDRDSEISWGGLGTIRREQLSQMVILLENVSTENWTTDTDVLSFVKRWEDDD